MENLTEIKWNEWARVIFDRSERQEKDIKELKAENKELKRQLADQNKLIRDINDNLTDRIATVSEANVKVATTLKIKSGVFGFLGGAVPVIVFILYEILKKVMKGE